MTKTIYRISKNKDNPFVQIDKRPLADKRLSWKAKGILAYLMSKPDDWEVIFSDIEKQSTDKQRSVRSGLQELQDAGYVWKAQERDASGQITKHLWIVFEEPQKEPPQVGGAILTKRKDGGEAILTFSINGKSRNGKKHTTNNELTNKEKRQKKNSGADAPHGKHLVKHPAMTTYREIARLYVPIALREDVAELIGEDEQRIDAWKENVKDWIGKGWNPRNVKGMMDYFKKNNELPKDYTGGKFSEYVKS